MEKSKIMKDDKTAWLSNSGEYYIRTEPTHTSYYTLEGERIPLAKGKCRKCGEMVESKQCGDFQQCGCGLSFVDTARWSPEIHRYGGDIIQVK